MFRGATYSFFLFDFVLDVKFLLWIQICLPWFCYVWPSAWCGSYILPCKLLSANLYWNNVSDDWKTARWCFLGITHTVPVFQERYPVSTACTGSHKATINANRLKLIKPTFYEICCYHVGIMWAGSWENLIFVSYSTCENKFADQLCVNLAAYQRLFFWLHR